MSVSVRRFFDIPIAFSIIALIAQIVLPEEKNGGLAEVEKRLRGIDKNGEKKIIMALRM